MLTQEIHRIRTDPAELADARSALDAWLEAHCVDWSARRDDIRLVFVELLTNAIDASSADGSVTFTFTDRGQEVVLRFQNKNDSLTPVELRSMPDPLVTEGRGLALAQVFADRLDIHALGEYVDITAHFFANRS